MFLNHKKNLWHTTMINSEKINLFFFSIKYSMKNIFLYIYIKIVFQLETCFKIPEEQSGRVK